MGGANSLGQHQCAVEDCVIQVSQSRLMCAYHWFKVPAELRREVSSLWTSWLKFHGQRTWDQYMQVRELAVAAVEEARSREQAGQ